MQSFYRRLYALCSEDNKLLGYFIADLYEVPVVAWGSLLDRRQKVLMICEANTGADLNFITLLAKNLHDPDMVGSGK